MSAARQPVVAVVFYSTYGHVGQLAESVIKGVEASGAVAKPYVFQETLPEEILTKMHAGSSLKPKYPVITPNDLKEVDGLIIGAPTRYGRVPAQVSAFFDACGQLWAGGALNGKFVTMFTSTAGQHGGQETTYLTTFPFFAHMGLVYVPIGYSNWDINTNDQVMGGSPYGASTIAGGDGSRQPLPVELSVAEYQGKYFSDFVGTFVRGKHLRSQATATATDAPVLGAAATTDSAKAVPEKVTQGEKEQGYQVPQSEETITGATAEPTATATPASEPKAAPAAAATTASPAAAPASQAAKPTAPQKEKKGGLFASCCGGRGIDN